MKAEGSAKPVPENEFLQARITRDKSVFIRSINPDVPLSEPVYAINWFNTRMLWLYNLYNLLGARAVGKVSGKACFKGKVKTVLHGAAEDRREMLLIVRYPAPDHFKTMLETTYFQLVSVLRVFAVRQFTFGFSRRSGASGTLQAWDKNKVFAIHHYRGQHDISAEVSRVVNDQGVEVNFSGRITAVLFSGDQTRPKDPVPCMMDGAIILQAANQAALEKAVAHADYQAIIQQTHSSFIATAQRML